MISRLMVSKDEERSRMISWTLRFLFSEINKSLKNEVIVVLVMLVVFKPVMSRVECYYHRGI